MTEEQIEAAAKMLAKCMDYPWAEMPTQGRITMRKHAQAIVAAGSGALGDGGREAYPATPQGGDTP